MDPLDVMVGPWLLDLTMLWRVYGVDRPALKDTPFVPATHPATSQCTWRQYYPHEGSFVPCADARPAHGRD